MPNIYDFTGKRVLVTGGGRGIGLGIVKKFLHYNATVIVMDNNEVLLQDLAINYPTVIRVKVDLGSWDDTRKAVENVLPINHLVNNAGVPNFRRFMDLTEGDIDLVFDINFKAYVNLSQLVVRDIVKNNIQDATIVNISSVADIKQISKGMEMYSCSKAAVTTLTRVMANELSSFGIRVNCIRPGATNTEVQRDMPQEFQNLVIKPLIARQLHNRMIETEEIADGVIFLSSKMSAMVTGTNLTIDGGLDL